MEISGQLELFGNTYDCSVVYDYIDGTNASCRDGGVGGHLEPPTLPQCYAQYVMISIDPDEQSMPDVDQDDLIEAANEQLQEEMREEII